jgi:hypothetical protein
MYNKSSQSSTQKQHNSTVFHAPQAEKVLKIKSFFAVSRPLHPTALGQSMAFKRSAVRSRLSPPKTLVFFENQGFFLLLWLVELDFLLFSPRGKC